MRKCSLTLVFGSEDAEQASNSQSMGHHVVLRDNWHGSSSPGGRTEEPHWLRAPRDRSESTSVRGTCRVDLDRYDSSDQLVGDGGLSCEEVFVGGSVRATEDMVAEGDDAIGIWRDRELWRRRTRRPSRLH